MNGLLEPDYSDSEFVEVDPTGRYGRVTKPLSLSHFLCVLCLKFDPFYLFFWLQYNEILGKGASKTVYEFKLFYFFKNHENPVRFLKKLN